MTLEEKLQSKYGEQGYSKKFSKDFREAVKGADTIVKIVSREPTKTSRKAKS